MNDRHRYSEFLRTYLTYYESYHRHKEQMAYGATTLYLVGAAYLVTSNPFWKNFGCTGFFWFFVLMLITTVLVFWFIAWQFGQRRTTALRITAVTNLLTKSLSKQPSEEDVKEVVELGVPGGVWPQCLDKEFRQIRRNRSFWWIPRDLTFAILLFWFTAAVARVWITGPCTRVP